MQMIVLDIYALWIVFFTKVKHYPFSVLFSYRANARHALNTAIILTKQACSNS